MTSSEERDMEPETVRMEDPPMGDCGRIPRPLVYSAEIPMSHEIVLHLLGSAARFAGYWVGVSLQSSAIILGISSIPAEVDISPARWMDLCADEAFVLDFLDAERAGLIRLEKGYAFPTQALANILVVS
jgi:hypothetical protein